MQPPAEGGSEGGVGAVIVDRDLARRFSPGRPRGYGIRVAATVSFVVLLVGVVMYGALTILVTGVPSAPCPPEIDCGPGPGELRLRGLSLVVLAGVGLALLPVWWRRWWRRQRFAVPPGWPQPPQGWRPPSGWAPQADWPTAPEGWQFWCAASRRR